MRVHTKNLFCDFLKGLSAVSTEEATKKFLLEQSPALFTSLKENPVESEEFFSDAATNQVLYSHLFSRDIFASKSLISMLYELIRIAYDGKQRQGQILFIKSLIPYLMSMYIIAYTSTEISQSTNNSTNNNTAPDNTILFSALLIAVYNFELENAKKLDNLANMNVPKELGSFYDRFASSLQNKSKLSQELSQPHSISVVYEPITSVNPQQHLVLCEVLIRVFCAELNFFAPSVISSFLRLVLILGGVSLDAISLRSNDPISYTKFQNASVLLVRVTPAAMQDIIFAVFQILLCHKQARKEANFCLDLMLSKTSNESQFKLADMCQAVIELTRDEYEHLYSCS